MEYFMPKFKVTSGEFEVIVHEKTPQKAGDRAIFLHNESNHTTKLGTITLVELLDLQSNPTGDQRWIATMHLLDANSIITGNGVGEYSHDN